MKLFIVLFLFIVVSCQAHQMAIRRQLIARQRDPGSDEVTLNDQVYEKFKKLAKKYMIELDPDLQTLLLSELRTRDPNINYPNYSNATPPRFHKPALKPQNSLISSSRFTNPAVNTRTLINELAQLKREKVQANAKQEARLAHVDKEALGKISEEDRQIIESRLSKTAREALLAQLEAGKFDDLFPREENRFGFNGMGAFSGAFAQIGSSAGGYIGGKLAGTLGARLGAAAGAYLGAAAMSRFVKKTAKKDTKYVSDDVVYPNPPGKEDHSKTYGFGAYNV